MQSAIRAEKEYPMKRIIIIFAVIMAATLSSAVAQVRVEAEKRATTIPKVCESIVPASIGDKVDVDGLVKEAICKGAGDMMTEFTARSKGGGSIPRGFQ